MMRSSSGRSAAAERARPVSDHRSRAAARGSRRCPPAPEGAKRPECLPVFWALGSFSIIGRGARIARGPSTGRLRRFAQDLRVEEPALKRALAAFRALLRAPGLGTRPGYQVGELASDRNPANFYFFAAAFLAMMRSFLTARLARLRTLFAAWISSHSRTTLPEPPGQPQAPSGRIRWRRFPGRGGGCSRRRRRRRHGQAHAFLRGLRQFVGPMLVVAEQSVVQLTPGGGDAVAQLFPRRLRVARG